MSLHTLHHWLQTLEKSTSFHLQLSRIMQHRGLDLLSRWIKLFFLFILDLRDSNSLWFDARPWHHMVWWSTLILFSPFSVNITVEYLNEVIADCRLHSPDYCLCLRCITLWIVFEEQYSCPVSLQNVCFFSWYIPL